jgi:hypothetical protein
MLTDIRKNNKGRLFVTRFAILILVSITFAGCSRDERMVKKFIKRINAREADKASSYIFPKDQAYLFVFNHQFLQNDEVVTFEINDLESGDKNNEPFVAMNLKCKNCSDNLKKYFTQRGIMKGDIVIDTIWIKTVNESSVLSFPWKWDTTLISNDLKLASVKAEVLNIRSGPGKNFGVVSQLKMNDKVLIDQSSENKNWLKCFTFDENGNTKSGYVSSSLTEVEEISFFNLGLFGKMGLLVASIIALIVIIVVIPLMATTIFRSAEDNFTVGIILFVVLIVIVVVAYQIIENVFFELFLLNMPF